MYVLMITPNQFPDGDAGAVRDYYFAKLYQLLGYSVIHIGMNRTNHHGFIDEIEYYSLYMEKSSIREKIRFALSYRKRLDRIVSLIVKNNGTPAVLHIYDIPASGIKYAKRLAGIEFPIVHDSVEWYSACEFRLGIISYPYLFKERTNRFLIKSPIRVIAISTYLQNYFSNRGLKCVRIPVMMEIANHSCIEQTTDKVRLIYAGSPARKDYLKVIISAFELLDEADKERFEFRILGVSQDQLEKLTNKECLSKSIIAMGRVDRYVVKEYLETSDFSVLLRPANERYAKAGFPTKVVEALSNGVAMLCNYSSDLEMYLSDMKNAVIVNGWNEEDFLSALKRILSLDREEIRKLKINAYNTAKQFFDYKLYASELKKIIGE